MKAVYRIADLNVEIDSMYEYVHHRCSDYQVSESLSMSIHVNREDVERERVLSAREDDRNGRKRINYSDPYLEYIAVYRQIAERLPEDDGFVFHGSAVAVEEQGYIFTAKSGTGKSTHAALWRKLLGQRARIINDDKPIIRLRHNRYFAYGTPWCGKENLNCNASVPLKAICILERADANNIREITRGEALPMLIQQVYRPSNPAAMGKTLALLDRLNVSFYRLGCNMDISAAELSYEMMSQARGDAL